MEKAEMRKHAWAATLFLWLAWASSSGAQEVVNLRAFHMTSGMLSMRRGNSFFLQAETAPESVLPGDLAHALFLRGHFQALALEHEKAITTWLLVARQFRDDLAGDVSTMTLEIGSRVVIQLAQAQRCQDARALLEELRKAQHWIGPSGGDNVLSTTVAECKEGIE